MIATEHIVGEERGGYVYSELRSESGALLATRMSHKTKVKDGDTFDVSHWSRDTLRRTPLGEVSHEEVASTERVAGGAKPKRPSLRGGDGHQGVS